MWQPALWILIGDWAIRIVFSIRIIMRPRSVGMSLAWLLVMLFPFVGTVVYLLMGENRLGYKRADWAARIRDRYQFWRSHQSPFLFNSRYAVHSDPAQLARMIYSASDALPFNGNQLKLLHCADDVFSAMIADIDQATHSCDLEYYIWEVGGQADELAMRLADAARRGVQCRILVDAVGSRGFLRSRQASELTVAGVKIHAALPVGLLRALLYRFDLRLHRKIVVIDHAIGYVGSQNMADPKLFKRGAGFGQWVDAMVRISGPAVDALAMVFFEDWQFETAPVPLSHELPTIPPVPPPSGQSTVQVIPSGPGLNSEAIMQILLNAIYMADRELILTTAYFVPDESLQRALISAARRGVDVTIVVPARVDSRLVRLASRPFLRELVASGVHVARYRDGMLHTKSISIDFDTSFFGSLNLDPRSLHLNFEIMLAVFDDAFTKDLRGLQQQYVSRSDLLTVNDLAANSFFVRFAENCVRLISPLL